MDQKSKILIIDDEPDLVEMLSYQFSAKGYDVVTAADGVEGLEKLKKIAPDLIILDLNMPRMGGIEFYQRICKEDGRPAYPVLVLTARANTRQLFEDFDVDGFRSKPFDIQELINEADLIIKRKNRQDVSKAMTAGVAKRQVIVVDDDAAEGRCILSELLKAGYKAQLVFIAQQGIEKIRDEVPEFALVKLGLSEISGDLLAFKLKHMAQTSSVKFILFSHQNQQQDRAVLERLKENQNLADAVCYVQEKDLVDEIDRFLERG